MPFMPKRKHLGKRRAPMKAKAAPKTMGAEVKLIKKVMKVNEETKYKGEWAQDPNAAFIYSSFQPFNAGITALTDIIAAIPEVETGTQSHQRIGNKISPIRAQMDFNMFVGAPGTDLNSYDITAHIFLVQPLSVKFLGNYTAIPWQTLMDAGNSSSTTFDGSTGNAMLPVNKEQFRLLKHKKVRLVKSVGSTFGTNSTSGSVCANGSISPDHKHFHSFSMKVPVAKTFKYEDSVSNYPTNTAPVCLIGWTYNDAAGASPPADGLYYLNAQIYTKLWYKDN